MQVKPSELRLELSWGVEEGWGGGAEVETESSDLIKEVF